MKIVLLAFIFYSSVYTKVITSDIVRYSMKTSNKIIYLDEKILKIATPRGDILKYVDISGENNMNLEKNPQIQVFDLPNIPDSLYADKYKLQSRIPIGQGLGYPLIFGDLNNNKKLDIAGTYKIIQDYEIGQAGIVELEDDSIFTLQYLYTYSDSSILPLSVTDLDKDGLLEINIKRGQTFRNYEQTNPDSFPMKSVFDYRMWQISSMVGSETFAFIDHDSLMDFVYVGDDTLEPRGNKFYVAEYNPAIHNFEQVFRISFPDWRVSGVSVGDFDGDGFKEITTANIYGDVYVVENSADNTYEHVFTKSLNTSNAYLNCATNDIDRNGKIEFFIGASSYWSGESATRVVWFEASGDNNYEIKREFFLKGTGVLGTTEMYSYDVNADGVDDLVFAFEQYVVILIWNNSTRLFEIYYINFIDLGYSEIQCVSLFDVYNNKAPNLFITIEDAINSPRLSTFYYKTNLLSAISNKAQSAISDCILSQNYPNPFNSTSIIPFYLPKSVKVNLSIFDITGKEVKKIIKRKLLPAGWHKAVWNGKDNSGKEVSSGVYIYQLNLENVLLYRKLIFIK